MPFKQNLLKKIKLDQMRQRVLVTLGPSGSGSKVDKKAMRQLLDAAGYRNNRLRGLDLFLPEGTQDTDRQAIFVLDNDMAIYDTTLGDVALRKEPTLKEMISIKNAIKILNDKDVVVSRGDRSLETVYARCLERLDLSFTPEDIRKLEYDGRAAVEWKDTEAVLEVLRLFEELLGFRSEPRHFKIDSYAMTGAWTRSEAGREQFGPSVVFSIGDGTIRLIEDVTAVDDKEGLRRFHDQVLGRRDPSQTGPSVFTWLADRVLATDRDEG